MVNGIRRVSNGVRRVSNGVCRVSNGIRGVSNGIRGVSNGIHKVTNFQHNWLTISVRKISKRNKFEELKKKKNPISMFCRKKQNMGIF